MGTSTTIVEPTIYEVEIDYAQTFEEMVIAGNYGAGNDGYHFGMHGLDNANINPKNFPIVGSGVVKIAFRLVQLQDGVGTQKVLAYLDQHGHRSAMIAELLAFGATKIASCNYCRITGIWCKMP